MDGELFYDYRPSRHHHCIHEAWLVHQKQIVTESQGFITSEGRYVDRKEGLEIAIKAGQIIPSRHRGNQLYSESVW